MTEHAYVLGHPVAHSKSPSMHNAVYRACGFDWEYGLADCASADEARAFLMHGDWRLLNVTMPYKPLALEAADAPSAAAQIVSGANVLIRDADGCVFADNTDGAGCVSYLQRCGVQIRGARVCVCGTGPTAISVMHACACVGAGSVVLLSRDMQRAAAALERYARALANSGNVGARPERMKAFPYETADGAIGAADIIIDATSLGMNAGDPAPFDTALLRKGQVVLDVVYGHGETALVRAARTAGCIAFDGAGMLVGQAVETLRDMEKMLGNFELPADFDAFGIMAAAAGFDGLGAATR